MPLAVTRGIGLLALLVTGCGSRSRPVNDPPDAAVDRHTVAIAAAARVACALRADGSVTCWEMPDGDPEEVVGLDDAIDLAVDGEATTAEVCAVRRDGTVRCVDRATGATRDVANIDGASRITSGPGFSCVLLSTGRVRCWGANAYGMLADGTLDARTSALDVPGIGDIVDVSAGELAACALTRDGRVVCWGRAYRGALGDGATHADCDTDDPCSATPVLVADLFDATAISAGLNHACAIRRGGGVACWGWNYIGQLGDGVGEDRETPTPVVGLDAEALHVRAGYTRGCAALAPERRVMCWGDDPTAPVTGPRNSATPYPVPALDGATMIAGGWSFLCALNALGEVTCIDPTRGTRTIEIR